MPLFLGYDPGGKKKNGVAAIYVEDRAISILETATVLDASMAIAWLGKYNDQAEALGIDTLLAWSPTGSRACDNALRRKYGGNSVVAQNSLYSAMTLNGAIVAKQLSLPVYESHPKLLLRTDAFEPIWESYQATIRHTGTDHEGDAVIAAWCAAMGHSETWTIDLYSHIEEDIELVVPNAKYPWFERVI